jgi:predicted TIM-barrel fold metal-dependent hydrolase
MGEGQARTIGRRTVLKAGIAALASARVLQTREALAQVAVPNSVGTNKPQLKVPPGACDCHHHIYDAQRFPPGPFGGAYQPNARVEEYRLYQSRIGTTRNIVVTPGPYIEDNRVTTDAIARLKPNARGVVQLRPSVTDAQLKALTDAGIVGLRFSQSPPTATTALEDIEPMTKRVAALGWHVQIYMPGDMIAAAEDLWNRLPAPMVFDHMGHLPQPAGVTHPAFGVLRRLIDKGKTWVKLSGAYIDTKVGPPTYADTTKVAQAFTKAAPERMVWGSDWPHPGLAFNDKPDDALLFDLLSEWAPNEAERHRILVENPQTLYGFAKA